MEEKLSTLTNDNEEEIESMAPEFVVQLVRALRIVSVHNLENAASQAVLHEFKEMVNRYLVTFPALQVQAVGDDLFFNNDFVKLKGAVFDSAIQIRRMYKRLGINEISFNGSLDDLDVRDFFETFQSAVLSQEPMTFASARFPKIAVRSIKQSHRVSIDRKLELARTYAQLVVQLQDACRAMEAEMPVPLARLRRAVQQLAQAAEGQESLLGGMTRLDNPSGDLAMHSVSVTALTLLMGMRLGIGRRMLISLALLALFHDIGRQVSGAQSIAGRAARGEAPDEQVGRDVLQTALCIARCSRSKDVLGRVCAAFEHALPAAGDGKGIIPSTGSRLISIACAFDSLTHPAPPASGTVAARSAPPRGIPPDQAMRLIVDHSGSHFDRKAVRLFTSVLGLYPVGSLVKLSGGQTAVVVSVPEDPAQSARPTVKVLREGDRSADYLLELDQADESVQIVEGLDAREEKVNVTHFLLA